MLNLRKRQTVSRFCGALHNSASLYEPYLSERTEPKGTVQNAKRPPGRGPAQGSHNALITIPVSSRHNPNWLDASHNTQEWSALWAMNSVFRSYLGLNGCYCWLFAVYTQSPALDTHTVHLETSTSLNTHLKHPTEMAFKLLHNPWRPDSTKADYNPWNQITPKWLLLSKCKCYGNKRMT